MSAGITQTTLIEAPLKKVREVILDVEAYPSWQKKMHPREGFSSVVIGLAVAVNWPHC